ncbi:phosphatase PAP2 family protein, partial [Patescibacteria group bacterium]|nr:phosphatase PAP2 family protein [Patescibacteria group bacterium]
RLGKLLFVFAFCVALSRIFVGVHYPLDVAVGLMLGYIVPKCIHTLLKFVKIARTQ